MPYVHAVALAALLCLLAGGAVLAIGMAIRFERARLQLLVIATGLAFGAVIILLDQDQVTMWIYRIFDRQHGRLSQGAAWLLLGAPLPVGLVILYLALRAEGDARDKH